MNRVECLVVGAGVIGLAVARELAMAGREVIVVEREHAFGTGISSRNSEVIHAGLYDAPGSLKATLAVEGRRLLYDYCASRHVGHRRCGKLVVAADDADVPRLEALARNAGANGVDDLTLIDADAMRALEPALAGRAALLSPSSGIMDTHALMTAYLADAEAHGATLVLGTEVRAVERRDGAWVASFDDGFHIACDWVINCAGLGAQDVAARIDGFPSSAIPTLYPSKGNYFAPAIRSPFSRLIYPMPVEGGLGVHLTLDLGGGMRFGPDVEWLDPHAAFDYDVDPARADVFYAEIRRYWPGLPDGSLAPAYCGIRPRLAMQGQAKRDFVIEGPADHGCDGLVQLFGIESPGITASLAIARMVATKMRA